MLSKAQIQLAQRLQQKKFRQLEKLFLVEGTKIVAELLDTDHKIYALFAVSEWMTKNKSKPFFSKTNCVEVTETELKKISALTSPNEVVCIVHVKENDFSYEQLLGKLSMMLSDIQDPGNFGTILRIADWFGIEHIICSPNTVENYNPKVVQASMGSFLRTSTIYTDLEPVLHFAKANALKSYGALLQGENIFKSNLSKNGILVLGNESKGIAENLIPYLDKAISIPSFATHSVDSLNVSIAAAILCAEFRR